MSSEELALTWDDHHSTLVGVFKKLLETSTLVDCTIAAEGRYLRAHKIILSACSPYFEMLFSQENEKNPIVVLKDIKFQELQAMIDFIYSGKVKVPEGRLGDFVDAAESLQIKGLGGDNYQKNNSGKDERISQHLTRKEDCTSPIPHKRSRQTFLSTNEENVGEISSGTNVSENKNSENVLHQMHLDMLDCSTEQNSCIASTTSCSATFSTNMHSNQIASSPLETVLPISETIVVKTEPEPIAEVYLPDFKPKEEDGNEDSLGLDSGGDITESVVDVNSQHTANQYSGSAAARPASAPTASPVAAAPATTAATAATPPAPTPCSFKSGVSSQARTTSLPSAQSETEARTPQQRRSYSVPGGGAGTSKEGTQSRPAEVAGGGGGGDKSRGTQQQAQAAAVSSALADSTRTETAPGTSARELMMKCTKCAKTFAKPTDFQMHQCSPSASSSARAHVCGACQKAFPDAKTLSAHARYHATNRRFKCHVCHAGFNVVANLVTHLRCVHKGPTPAPAGALRF